MVKKIIYILFIINTLYFVYYTYDMFFKKKSYNYPVFYGNGTDKILVWEIKEEEAPMAKFIYKFKEKLKWQYELMW